VRRRTATRRVAALLAGLLAVAALTAGGGMPASATEEREPLTGTGSTWAQNAIDRWRGSAMAEHAMTVNYSGIGSTAGRADFIGGRVDFAISDVPFQTLPEAGQAAESPPTDFAYVPILAGGLSFMYHLRIDGVRVTDLRLSGETIAGIFAGTITNWSDAAIQADNPHLAMPDLAITPVVRRDDSATSVQLTRWLATEHPSAWPTGVTSLLPPPAGGISQTGSSGVAGYVSQGYGYGAITYVEQSYAFEAGFPAAKVRNRAGYYVAPTADAVSIALLGAQTDASGAAVLDAVYASPDPRAYPVSSYTSMIVPTAASPAFSTGKGAALAAFATHAVCEWQSDADGLGNAPLPISVVQQSGSAIQRIPGAGAFDMAACANPTFAPGDTIDANTLLRDAPMPPESDRYMPTASTVTEQSLTPETRTLEISTAAGSSVLTLHAGGPGAGKTLSAGAFSEPVALGLVALDQAGAGTVDIIGAGFAEGEEHRLYLAESDGTVIAWNTFTVPAAAGPDEPEEPAESATEVFELRAPTTDVVELGRVQRNAAASASLGSFTVVDDRSERRGWALQVSVEDFALRGGDDTQRIPASALGFEPVATGLPAGIALSGQTTGSASYPAIVAQGELGSTTGTDGLSLDATISFVPPAAASPGDYRSTLTLTLVSR
jgi:phosphate transport system substrate-binding protein